MSLLLDHPFFDAVGLGVDSNKVGVGLAPLERPSAPDHAPTYAERAAADPFADDESRCVRSAQLAATPGTLPLLLEYHHPGDDEELNFIPKTVAGFAVGAMALGFCLNLVSLVMAHNSAMVIYLSMAFRFGIALGITGVAASLLLVGLKVRADHTSVILHSRHWMNSITTGAIFALLAWGPWLAIEHKLPIEHFVIATIWMVLFFFPAIAARWTVGPVKHFGI